MAAGRGVANTSLVTGSSGFIGSAVIRALLAQGSRVRALLEPGREPGLWPVDDVEIIVGDVRDAAVVDRAVADIDTVFHLAAIYRFWAPDPELVYDVNVRDTQNVLRSAARAGCRRVVYTSAVATLGVATADELASEKTLVHFEHLFGQLQAVQVHGGTRGAAGGWPGEILVSRTVADLVPGSDIHLGDRGEHELTGVQGSWRLFEVMS